MKKILIVCPYFYPNIGGVENYVYNIAKRLTTKYEIIIVTTNQDKNKISILNIDKIKIYKLPIQFTISNTPINLFWYFDLKKIIKRESPEIINIHLPVPFLSDLAGFIAKKRRISYFVTYHSGSMKKEKGLFLNLLIYCYEKFILRSILKNSTKIITSGYAKEYLKKTFKELILNKIIPINPGVDLDLFRPFKIKKEEPKFKIVFSGRIDSTSFWKGQDYLFEAVVQLIKEGYNLQLNLIGEGNLVEDYKKKYQKYSQNIQFLGKFKYEDVPKELCKNDVLILPSITESESFGMVLAEANACGLPIIGSRIGGIPEIIQDNYNGLLVNPKNISDLKEAILKLYNNKEFRIKLGNNGLKKAQEFWDWEKITKKTEGVFEE